MARNAAAAAARLTLSRVQWRALITIWVTYGSFYFCRVNIGPANKTIQTALTITPLEMGFVLGAIKIGYAFGQLLNGQLVERFGPKRILMLGMFGSVAATFGFAACSAFTDAPPGIAWLSRMLTSALRVFSKNPDTSVGPLASLLLLIALANGYFQAGGWPSTVKVMSNWFSVEQRGRLMGIIGTSYQIGSAITILAAGLLIRAFGSWRAAFIVPGAVFLLSAIHTLVRLRSAPNENEREGAPPQSISPLASSVSAPPRRTRARMGATLWATVTNGPIWVLALGLFGLDIVRYGFLDWAPGQLQEAHHSDALGAALKIAVLPLAGAVGALVSGWLSDIVFDSRRAPVIALMLLATAALTLLYPRVVVLGTLPTMACLGGIGFFLYGAQILLVGTAAQDFARRGATAAAAGFVDFTGSMGAFGGDVVTGWCRQSYGWSGAIAFWAAAALGAALIVAVLWNARPRAEPA